MEGMGSGKAVIATDIGGMPDMIDPGSTGMLVTPDDVDALAQAMQMLLNNPTMMTALGATALASVGRLKASAVVSRIESVYETVRETVREKAA
jgi:glycosyltransferase involved in cell wall biosynthesis